MGTVADILRNKGSAVHTVAGSATVIEATRVMNDRRVGSVIITDERGRVEGILTERDLLTRVLAKERDPKSTFVGEIMTTDVVWCTPETRLDELRSTIMSRRIRHIPVQDGGGRLIGLVSIGDVNAFEAAEMTVTIASLEQYIARG